VPRRRPEKSYRVHRAEHTVEIDRPPSDVFPYLVEPELMTRWIGGLVEFRPLDEGAARVGARSLQKVHQAGRTWEVESEILELVRSERLAARAEASAFTTVVAYELEPMNGGTRLTGAVETELKGLGRRLLGGVAGRAAEHKLASDLGRLKQLLET
jgi:uncharacterized protein YndB with AHSA1/START domain